MQDPYLHIEAYLAGQLSAEEKAAFEAAMVADEKLKQAVEDFDLVSLIGDGLLEEEIASIVESSLSINTTEKANDFSDKPKSKVPLIIFIALTALLLLALNRHMFQKTEGEKSSKPTVQHKQLMAELVFPDNRGTRSLSTAGSALDSAIHYFDLRQFDNSEDFFVEILSQDSSNQTAIYYMSYISFVKEDYVSCRNYCRLLEENAQVCDLVPD